MIGKTVLGYQVDEKIGSGGFGTVYKVSKSNVSGTYVRALKHITLPSSKTQYNNVLNSMGGDYSKADDYFAAILNDIVSEINILSSLSESGNKNVVRYYENDITETSSPKTYDIYILMEYLTPLPEYVESHPFTVRDVIAVGKNILNALISCHENNIIHRDIKDDNIFVSSDGIYKLGDFGVSKSLKDKSRANSVKGTPNYIAPEVYLGKEAYDSTVDLYSLGIVLYRMLNNLRLPFMPKFPETYTSADEDAAFEARMSGKIPELPNNAQNALGEAVLKAIMPRADRYNSASEFMEALESAEKTLEEEVLSLDLGISIPAELRERTVKEETLEKDIHGDKTIGSDVGDSVNTDIPNEDKDLFGTISEKNNTPTPPPEAPNPEEKTPAPVIPEIPTARVVKDGPVQVAAIEKKDFKWLIYAAPFIIAAIWLIVYIILIPNVYGKGVSLIEWLFNNPDKIIEKLKDPNTVLMPIAAAIGLKVFNWALFAAFITSLFFVGHTIQNKKPEISSAALVTGKEPYLMAMAALEEIKLVKDAGARPAENAVYKVCERLKNESAFGSGSTSVINCENEIAAYLETIEATIPALRDSRTVGEAAGNIDILCQKILSKLKIRIELKKK